MNFKVTSAVTTILGFVKILLHIKLWKSLKKIKMLRKSFELFLIYWTFKLKKHSFDTKFEENRIVFNTMFSKKVSKKNLRSTQFSKVLKNNFSFFISVSETWEIQYLEISKDWNWRRIIGNEKLKQKFFIQEWYN